MISKVLLDSANWVRESEYKLPCYDKLLHLAWSTQTQNMVQKHTMEMLPTAQELTDNQIKT